MLCAQTWLKKYDERTHHANQCMSFVLICILHVGLEKKLKSLYNIVVTETYTLYIVVATFTKQPPVL